MTCPHTTAGCGYPQGECSGACLADKPQQPATAPQRMSAQHTPGRLAQGHALRTRVTERWTKEEWDRNEAREKCLVFTHYTPIDQGLGRKLVAQCHQGPEDARRLVACWNACEGLHTESLECGKPLGDQLVEALNQRDELLAENTQLKATQYGSGKLQALRDQRDELLEFAEEVRRSGDTRLASMAIAVLAKVNVGSAT